MIASGNPNSGRAVEHAEVRRIALTLTTLAGVAAATVALGLAAPGADTAHPGRVRRHPPSGGVLSTITHFQLTTVGVALDPPAGGASQISAGQGDADARKVIDRRVRETALVRCTVGSVVDLLCWAVSLQPPAGLAGPTWGGPAIADGKRSKARPWTFTLVLIDAVDGSMLVAINSGVPRHRPTPAA